MEIIVIGAGISGILSAYFLNKAGYKVCVVDTYNSPAMLTSYGNAGQLSPSNSEAWHSWHSMGYGFLNLFNSQSAMKIGLKPSFYKYYWFIKFILSIKNYEKNTKETLKQSIESLKIMRKHFNHIDYFKLDNGLLHFYTDKKSLEGDRKLNQLFNKEGLNRYYCDRDKIKEIEPTIVSDLAGGFYSPEDFSGDIHIFCRKLTAELKEKGVDFLFNTQICQIKKSNDNWLLLDKKNQQYKCKKVVVCAGVYSKKISYMLGDNIPIYPAKGYSVSINIAGQNKNYYPKIAIIDKDEKIATSTLGNIFRVAGMAEFVGYNRDIKMNRIEQLLNWVHKYFPNLDTSDYSPWAGLRPMMPNMLSVVKESKQKGVYYNTGHGHLGWTLSAYTADKLTKIVK